jgi:cell division protein ZapB
MPKIIEPSIIDQEITRLEEQVDILLHTVDRLMKENKSLRAQQESHTTERATLIERNDQVRNRVDAIVTRLKSLESGA